MKGYELGQQAEAFLEDLLRKGRKESTVGCYRNGLRQCFLCLESDGRSTRAEEIDADDVQFLWHRLEVKEEVRQGYLRCLARYTLHYTGRDVVKQADILRNREKRDRVFIDRKDFEVLAANADPFQRIILVLGGMMGLRRNEIRCLRDEDIEDDVLLVHGKGHGRDGLVSRMYLPPEVGLEIRRYREWKNGRLKDSGDGYLVQTRSRRGEWSMATPQQISGAVRELGLKCGIPVTTHSLRRLYATSLYYDGKTDPVTVKNLMRHADIATTMRCYIDAYDAKERDAAATVSAELGALLPSCR